MARKSIFDIDPNKVVEQTNKIAGKEVVSPAPKKKTKVKTKKTDKSNRVKFTTMLDPALTESLRMKALQEKRSAADILTELITSYLKK